MSDRVKIALIAALAVLAAVTLYIHFSPYQTCVRAKTASDMEMAKGMDAPNTEQYVEQQAQISCAH